MKISEVIKSLEDYKKQHGDVSLFKVEDYGHASFAYPYIAKIEYKEIWKNHPDGKKFFIV